MNRFEQPTKNDRVQETLSSHARPIITSVYTADPAATAMPDGKLYIYPSRDMDPARGCDRMDRYHVYSTKDMAHFTDEGEILRADSVSWGRPEGGFMWAPDCKQGKDGRFYYYYPHPSDSNWNDSWKIGVAVSKTPYGPFEDLGYIEGIGGWCMIDPSIFLDDDGEIYLYFGGGAMPRAVKLEDDMMTVKDGKVYELEGLEDFHEASYLFKREGIYYMTYSDNVEGRNRMHYATSPSPLGPFEHRGVYLEYTGCDTSHGSVVFYRDHWFCFYHNCALSGRGNLRSVCVDELFFEKDGSIRVVSQTKEEKEPMFGEKKWDVSGLPFVSPDLAIREEDRAMIEKKGAVIEPGKSLTFTKVDGRDGGRVSIHFEYETKVLSHLRLWVGDTDWSFINLSPDRQMTSFTVPLQKGKTNTLSLTFADGEGYFKGFYLEYLGQLPTT